MNRAHSFEELTAGFASELGLELAEASGDRVVAQWDPAVVLKSDNGTVSRGAHSSVVETLASIGAALWMGDQGQVVGVSNSTDFFQANAGGPFVSTATPVDRGDTQQLWMVTTHDHDEALVARGHVRLANLYPES